MDEVKKERTPPAGRRRATMPATPEPPRSLSEEAYSRLEELIVTLELAPGELVSEAGLCATLGIGRTPIREALQRLQAEHLVRILPKRGAIIEQIHIEQHLLALEVRRALERLVAARAAHLCTDDKRERFESLADEMEAAAADNDARAFLELDREFHALLTETARNQFATAALAPFQALSRRYWYMHQRRHQDMVRSATLHAAVMRAVAAGDSDAAIDAIDALLSYAHAVTRDAVTVDFDQTYAPRQLPGGSAPVE
jgi:DNA-binding GntR family transcriptional regulator